jgi:hypothetical protein
MPVGQGGIGRKIGINATLLARKLKLQKAWKFMMGEHPWVAPAFVAAGSAPVLGLILEQHNKDNQAMRQGVPMGYPYGPPGYPDQGEGAVLEARRAVKEALDKSAAQPQLGDGLDCLCKMLRAAKNRSA